MQYTLNPIPDSIIPAQTEHLAQRVRELTAEVARLCDEATVAANRERELRRELRAMEVEKNRMFLASQVKRPREE